jgi:hypothetical protein
MYLKHVEYEGWHEFVMRRSELMPQYNEVCRWLAETCAPADRRMHALRTHWYMIKLRNVGDAVTFALRYGD